MITTSRPRAVLHLLAEPLFAPREYMSAGDYVPLDTKFGPVSVCPVDWERVQVEMREPVVIDGVPYLGCLTMGRTESGFRPIGRVTRWGSQSMTERREARFLAELGSRLVEAAAGPLAQRFAAERRRAASMAVRSVEEDIEKARKALSDLLVVRESLVAEEGDLCRDYAVHWGEGRRNTEYFHLFADALACYAARQDETPYGATLLGASADGEFGEGGAEMTSDGLTDEEREAVEGKAAG